MQKKRPEKKEFEEQMWQPHQDEVVEQQNDSVSEKGLEDSETPIETKWNYTLLFVCFVFVAYFLYLLLQHQFYQWARFEVLRSQTMPLTGAAPDPKTNFFAAVAHYERLIRG